MPTTIHSFLIFCLGAALLTGCSQSAPATVVVQPAPARQTSQVSVHLPNGPRFRTTPSLMAPIPADTSATGLAGALADVRKRSYFLTPTPQASATRTAENVAQRLTAQLGATTYTIAAAPLPAAPPQPGQLLAQQVASKPAWQVRFALRGIGRNGKVSFRPQEGAPSTSTDTTVAYQHGNTFSVDYLNSPDGVRQNYHLAQRPTGATGSVQVLLDLDTKLHVRAEGDQVLSFNNTKESVLHYSGLKAWDATGRTLPAHLALQEGARAGARSR